MADLAVTQRQAKRMIDRLSAVALPVIFVLPLALTLALTLVWGPFFADSAYDALRYAQNVAAAR